MKIVCDVCDTEISSAISMEPYPDYQTTISIRGLSGPNKNPLAPLPEHLTDMHLMAIAPILRCSSCGVENDQCSATIFENLAHIKAFSAMPDGRFLSRLRNHFKTSRTWLARKIGYESEQSIYRFENLQIAIPVYAQINIINTFLLSNDTENDRGKWIYNLRDWIPSAVDIAENKAILVPLPVERLVNVPDYDERKYREAVKRDPSLAMIE